MCKVNVSGAFSGVIIQKFYTTGRKDISNFAPMAFRFQLVLVNLLDTSFCPRNVKGLVLKYEDQKYVESFVRLQVCGK